MPSPPIKYAKNGSVSIAYQAIGEGPIDLVLVHGWVSHLELNWEEPSITRFFERLASFSRLILFDKRGTGMSDRVAASDLPTLEQRMEDVHAVLNAVGSKRAALMGISEGGPICALFAATYPERTGALIMCGSYARWIRDDDCTWAMTREQHEAAAAAFERNWGTPIGFKTVAPTSSTDALGTVAELHLTDSDVWIHVAPLFHLADAWATWAITLVGGTHVLVREFDPKIVFETIEREKVTITNLIHTMLNLMVNHPEVKR